jgi:dUTP pyrophosphatase
MTEDEENKIEIPPLQLNGELGVRNTAEQVEQIEPCLQIYTPEEKFIFDNFGMSVDHPVKFKKVHPSAKLPSKQHKFDACWDLYSVEEVDFLPMGIQAVDTGLQMEMPPYLEATIRPRSGLAIEGITIVNSPGTIDSGYRGNIKVILINLSQWPRKIEKGSRIAQMQFGLTQSIKFEEVKELNDTERGEGGFGSTGK